MVEKIGHTDISNMPNTFEVYLESFKKKHPAWFNGQMVNIQPEVPKTLDLRPSTPVVEPLRKDIWDEIEERNDA